MVLPQTQGRVLLVDDEPQILRAYTRLLVRAGYSVENAQNGKEATELLEKQSFDVILSDISMPGMNGLDLLRAVRERDLDVPVLLMTGDPQLETAVKALEYGALRYLVKSMDEGELPQI